MPEFDLKYFKRLIEESDRGCVLLTTSFLDELLEQLHRTHIKSTASPPDKLIKELFTAYAPLSTLSARIKLARAYGLISHEDYLDLELLRDMRNDAAHTLADFAFDLPEIQNKVVAFTAPKRMVQSFPLLVPTDDVVPTDDAKRQFLAAPTGDKQTIKLYFLTVGMCLSMVLLDTIKATLHQQWSGLKQVVAKDAQGSAGKG
jgi:DNA-binding MltR family transcriptional regulator